MKRFLLLVYVFFTHFMWSQAPGCANVDAGPSQIDLNCSTGCADLTATFLETGETTSYDVTAIPFSPPSSFSGLTNQLFFTGEDLWSSVITIPFDFCFFGSTYNQLLVGINGTLSFQTINAGGGSDFIFASTLPNNSDEALREGNIFGAGHDLSASSSGGTHEIAWEIQGVAPCRRFVASYYNVPQFNCSTLITTQMMVLYEGTNTIEVYIEEKPTCDFWVFGNAVVGIQNDAGTEAVSPPGRNTSNWIATNEAWRFTPNGTPNYNITWYDGSGVSIGNTPSINVCPTADETFTVEVAYTNCNGSTFTGVDTVDVIVNATPTVALSSNSTTCSGGNAVFTINGTAGDIVDYTGIVGSPTSPVTLDASGTAVITVVGVTTDQTITLTNVTNPTTSCSGALNNTETVTISATPTVTLSSNSTTCSGGNAVFTINGTAGDIVDYTGVAGSPTSPVALDASGTAVITVAGVTTDQTIIVTNVINPTTGCSATLNTTETVSISATPTVTLSSNMSTCSGGNAVFTINGTAGDIVDYTGIVGSPTSPVTLDASGTAVITVAGVITDQTITLTNVTNPTTSCSGTLNNTETVSISATPTVTLSSNSTTCSGGNAVFTINGTAGDIVDYTGIVGSLSSPVTLDASGTAIITVAGVTTDQTIILTNVTNPTTGCSGTLNNTETVSISATPTVTLSSNLTSCSGGNAVFTINGTAGDIVDYTGIVGSPVSPVTLDASGTAVITVSGITTDQTIIVTNVTNPTTSCSGTLSATETVTISATPTVTLSSNMSTCSGGNAVFTING
ncbi:beta strand repeat-containing protein, partial [Lacinutrix gracilariae]